MSQARSTSPTHRGRMIFRKGSFALDQEDSLLIPTRSQGALATLLRNRSYGSLPNSAHIRTPLEDEESVPARPFRRQSFFASDDDDDEDASPNRKVDERRLSAVLLGPQMRSMRLIGNSNPRYRWARYWKTEEQLKVMKKPLRQYYERTNYLVQQYMYIDRLLDSSLPHDLLNEYNNLPENNRGVEIPDTIQEEFGTQGSAHSSTNGLAGLAKNSNSPDSPEAASVVEVDGAAKGSSVSLAKKVKRTPKDIYRATETTPLFHNEEPEDEVDGPDPEVPWLEEDEDLDSGAAIVTLAIYVNFAANFVLLAGKLIVVFSASSMSVLASLVDAVLDFLSTAIVWTTTWLISRQDQYKYPVGRRRLEPLGVLVFSVIMITSFVQVALESLQRLASPEHEIIELTIPAIGIMVGTVLVKGICWLWCRMVKNSSVQALAEDAITDVIFNTGSILFPIVGFYAKIWWLDALGGLLLSCVVIFNWSRTSLTHIKNLSGFSATADQRNILLYLTMRFAKTIQKIQGLQAYHAGDKLNVEVDIVLDASTNLRDSHDLAESLGYVLESVPIVDRAFVHTDYASYNLPTHMQQQAE